MDAWVVSILALYMCLFASLILVVYGALKVSYAKKRIEYALLSFNRCLSELSASKQYNAYYDENWLRLSIERHQLDKFDACEYSEKHRDQVAKWILS